MIRITGGEFRGRLIQTAPQTAKDTQTRPTQARLRQALFNSIQMQIPDSRVLDLFAGSGALAFEALSRGAAHAILVENSIPAQKLIQKNIAELRVSDRAELIGDSVDRAVERLLKKSESADGPFDIVLADPPYAAGWELRLLNELPWDRLLRADGRLCLEWGLLKSKVSELPDELPFLVKAREKIYGESVLTTYAKKG